MIMMWGGNESNIPPGWLLCDGSALNQAQYADLYAAIGTNFGAQPPAGDFYIPDLRGRFVRGQDLGLGRDPDAGTRTDMQNTSLTAGATVGSLQGDAFQSHAHTYTMFPAPSQAGNGIAGGSYWAVQDGVATGTAGTSAETRPVNVYLIYIIKI
jgi:microcystin-dependent protein